MQMQLYALPLFQIMRTRRRRIMIKDFINADKSAGVSTALGNALKDVGNTNAKAAATANDISREAQAWQGAFNAAMANNANQITQLMQANQAGYNAEQAAAANKLQEEYWKHSAEYNTNEAEKNRQWQEYMSSTAYQRAVEDLKKAGLNPILAAMNGGAFTGGGATATMGPIDAKQASIGNAMGTSASVGNYSGILENTSNQLALVGAIVDGMESLIHSASESGLTEAIDTMIDEANGILDDASNKLGMNKGYTQRNHPNSSRRTGSNGGRGGPK